MLLGRLSVRYHPVMSLKSVIAIRVNGAPAAVSPGTTPADLLDQKGLAGPGIAVAVNDVVVRRADLSSVALVDGDRIEIIRAVGGG